jgi:hypothetical protein
VTRKALEVLLKSKTGSADGSVLAFIQIAPIGEFQKYSFRSVVEAFEYDWGHRSTGVQEYRSSGVQEFRSSGVQEFGGSGVWADAG